MEHINNIKDKQLVSMISDFGTVDFYLAKFKASIYKKCPSLEIIDVNHHIPLHDISLAAFQLKNIIDEFPEGSIHLVAVNNHYNIQSRYFCFEVGGQYFIGPDNGIFSLIFPNLDSLVLYEILPLDDQMMSASAAYVHAISCIYHGLPMSEFTKKSQDPLMKIAFKPVVTSTQLRATVIHIDHFGNVITNLSKKDFEEAKSGRRFKLYYDPHDPLEYVSKSYASVPVGDPLCTFNESNLLEIAINMGNAAQLLNLKLNETIQIDFHD
ncbi:MAG: SAM-dependent chlorinase/fluorinase [Saprospiraceae bacterium]|nr:SAM-dependent chlorinase/fluorinase [Saprospiraceae bacterium]